MKRILSVVALVCATVLAVSCQKEDNQDSVSIVGEWLYIGCDRDDPAVDVNSCYRIGIDASSITVYRRDGIPDSTCPYTRKGNTLTFTKADFLGRYDTAEAGEIAGVGVGLRGICLDCGNGYVYNFKESVSD